MTPVDEHADHVAGPRDAPVTLLEYGDYQCPFTRAAAPVVDAVRARLGRQLRFVWRHLPLERLHPLSGGAAEAAEAAAAQGAFWSLHAALLADPPALTPAELLEHARRAGVPDLDRFRRELADHTYRQAVDAAIARAVDAGVPGAPTFSVNGARYQGPLDERALGQAVSDAAEERVRPR